MDSAWQDRREQWRRFSEWEDSELRRLPYDYRMALGWMSEAWELAERADPAWGSPDEAERHWKELAQVREALSKLGAGAQ